MDFVIFGGSGFVGQHLAKYLEHQGHQVWIASRSAQSNLSYGTVKQYNPNDVGMALHGLDREYSVINLAGESINSGRWTLLRKKRILESRVQLTTNIVAAIQRIERKPKVLVNASAVGFYGYSEQLTFTEDFPRGSGFLADVTGQWEEAAALAKPYTRVVCPRLGLVLGRDGGALPRMVAPYKWFIGGTVGSGEQWVSWVHVKDVCGMIDYCIQNEYIEGAVNVTAPGTVQMNEFGEKIGEVLHKPHWMPVPSLLLRGMLGEMSEIVLKGQRAVPKKLQLAGYHFQYHSLNHALEDLYSSHS